MKDDTLYLVHILECIERIEAYTSEGSKDDFMTSSLIQDAVLRNLQILAESSQRNSETSKHEQPEIDWRKLSGFRNVLVHDYLGVDMERVWNITLLRMSSHPLSEPLPVCWKNGVAIEV